MVNFEDGVLAAQFFGNYGMVEIYVNILAGMFLLASSLAAIAMTISYGMGLKSEVRLIGSSIGPGGIKMAERGLPGWQYISMGVLYVGLIGFGELMEHLFKSPITIYFYDYLTMLSPPVALYFFYLGIKKHVEKEIVVFYLVRFILVNVVFYIVCGGLSLATMAYGDALRNFFLYFIVIPVLILSVIVFRTAWSAYEKYLVFMPTVSAMVLATAFLALVTLVAQLSVVFGYGDFYIVGQTLIDILMCVTGTSIFAYGGAVRMIRKQRI
jgi:hypothetical protein